MDVVFLVDCSDAKADEDAWNSTLRFVDDAVSDIGPRSGGSHVALALFGDDQTVVVVRKLDDQPLHAVVGNPSTTTCPGRGRDRSRSLRTVFSNTDGDRPDVPDVLVLIAGRAGVDGVEAAAESLKEDGITIVTVALGTSEQILHQLLRLASSVDDAEKLVVARADHYRVLLPTLVNVLCRTVDTGQFCILSFSLQYAHGGYDFYDVLFNVDILLYLQLQ